MSETIEPRSTAEQSSETQYNFKLLCSYVLKKWWWFAISIIIIVGGVAFYLKKTNPTYTTFAKVMFNQDDEDDKPAGGTFSSLMASFNMSGGGVNVTDEIIRMQSHSAIKRVVKELELNKDYTGSTAFWRKDIIYFQNSPIEIECAPGMLDTIEYTTKFKLTIKNNGKKLHLKVKQGVYKTVFNADIPKLPYTVKTPLGSFTLTPTSFYKPEKDLTFKAEISNYDDAAETKFHDIDVFLSEKKSNAVDVKIDDKNNKRARAIANTVVELYNINSVIDRSQRSKATLDFLNERLMQMYGELERSGSGIAAYKENHSIVNPEAEAAYIFKIKESAGTTLLEQETQLRILNMLRDFLKSTDNKYALIPITSVEGQNSEGTNAAINTYNDMVLELMRMQTSAKGNNSGMRQLEAQLEALRANMLTGLDRNIAAMNIAISRMSNQNSNVNTRISSIPRMEQELTNLMRDNEIKNRIYSYLLQKREETEVKLARTLPTGKVIDEAWTNADTMRPQKLLVLMAAFLLALLIPACLVISRYRRQFVKSNSDALNDDEQTFAEEIG